MTKSDDESGSKSVQFKTFAKAGSGGKINMDGAKFVGDLTAEKFAEATDAGEISMVGLEIFPTSRPRGMNLVWKTVIALLVAIVGGVVVAWFAKVAGLNH